NKIVYPNNASIQLGIDSESIYGVYVIHTCFKELFSGLENEILYKPGEVILSSVEISQR
ncbi:9776_t:CDS:2, partial [Entrophospora sp. SA101]